MFRRQTTNVADVAAAPRHSPGHCIVHKQQLDTGRRLVPARFCNPNLLLHRHSPRRRGGRSQSLRLDRKVGRPKPRELPLTLLVHYTRTIWLELAAAATAAEFTWWRLWLLLFFAITGQGHFFRLAVRYRGRIFSRPSLESPHFLALSQTAQVKTNKIPNSAADAAQQQITDSIGLGRQINSDTQSLPKSIRERERQTSE